VEKIQSFMNVKSNGTYCYYGTLNNKQLFIKIFEEKIQNHVLCFNIIAKLLFFIKINIRYVLHGFPMCECLFVSAYFLTKV